MNTAILALLLAASADAATAQLQQELAVFQRPSSTRELPNLLVLTILQDNGAWGTGRPLL